jgi:hypothetical protein
MAGERIVRIGGASAAWGDSLTATPQLLAVQGLDYLVYDYLAEVTMAILARQRHRNPRLGYAHDFVTGVVGEHLEAITAQGVRLVANAGGLNALSCAQALDALARERGVALKVAAVTGDDVIDQSARLAGLPQGVLSANAYTGATGIARALELGAQVVVTGRCVDSALVLGPLAREFGWRWDDWDRLAQGSLAGHIIECGAQATGGLFTDWQKVLGWDDIGYPVLECSPDGSFVVSKPAGTGGLVRRETVAEQVLYELGDPSAYALADVTCDFRDVRLEPAGAERVRVSGARGRPPTPELKVSVTYERDFQVEALALIRGVHALDKARKTAEAFLARTRRMMRDKGFGDYAETRIECLGADSQYGPRAGGADSREIVLRVAARHASRAALEFLRKEVASAGVSMGPGTGGLGGGRPEVRPCVRHHAAYIARDAVRLRVHFEGREEVVPAPAIRTEALAGQSAPHGETAPAPDGGAKRVPLVRLAWARSGDKGDTSNIGVIARRSEYLPWIRRALTPEAVGAWFAHLMRGRRVERYELPGLGALNFLLYEALGGGGSASLSSDPLGKSYAQILLEFPVEIPARLLDE